MFKMKVYLQDLNIDAYKSLVENKGDNILGKKYIKNEIWFLTPEGKIKIIDDNYYKYKLRCNNEREEYPNHIGTKTCFCEKGYFKKMMQSFNIPLQHHKIDVKKIVYNRDPSISLIVEKTNNQYSDIYFYTNNDIREVDIKSAITSFAEYLT